jgi:pimeloyl-ACP methyl ester carboxylesterase
MRWLSPFLLEMEKSIIRLVLSSIILFSLNVYLLLAQESPFPSPEERARLKIGEHVLKPGTFANYAADFGIILVPENRNNPDSKTIHLAFIRIHSLEDHTAEPIFLLNGGPGKTNIRGVLPSVFFKHNDLVIVGYRGIDSSVKLSCPEVSTALTGNNPLSSKSIVRVRKIIRESYNRFIKEGIDINGYTVLEVVDDIEAVRRALGYGSINLFSSSYGTILAYVCCLRYPQKIRRNLMVGASNISHHLVRGPEAIDRVLRYYDKLWKDDPKASARSPDILKTMQSVLKTLPRHWKDIRIDPDKIKIITYWLLYETETAARLFDAYVAAEHGDYSGLAVLSYSYDDEVGSREYWCEYFSKVLSCGLDPSRDLVQEMDPPGTIIGSPSVKLLLGAASQGGWPITPIPQEYCKMESCGVETLVVMGNLDPSSPLDYIQELMPYFRRGQLAILSDMGHMDPSILQPEAFNHLGERFYSKGIVDTSKYVFNRIDFEPEETYQDYAKELLMNKKKK